VLARALVNVIDRARPTEREVEEEGEGGREGGGAWFLLPVCFLEGGREEGRGGVVLAPRLCFLYIPPLYGTCPPSVFPLYPPSLLLMHFLRPLRPQT